MIKKTLTAAAAAVLMCASSAQGETINYRVGLDLTGSWSESVRADVDEGDRDGDGTEEVITRDTAMRFALRATMPDVPLRDGRVPRPHCDVAQAALTQEIAGTFTDWDNSSGTCGPQEADATGGGTIASIGTSTIVFRPSSDAAIDVAFALPPRRFGDWRISAPVRASAAQRAFDRCPREAPGTPSPARSIGRGP